MGRYKGTADWRKHALKRYEKHRRKNLLAQSGVHDVMVVLDHLKAGFNVPKIFRSAEAFGANSVALIGIEPFDPAPAKGAFKHVPARFYANFSSCYEDLSADGYCVFTLEASEAQVLTQITLPKKCAFVFGHEEHGLSFERADYADIQGLSIPQFGRTESLNVSVAASIVLYEYVRQHGQVMPSVNVSSSLDEGCA